MLKTLHISNYALIDIIDIEFQPGLNILTGETGAGKSIIMGALGLLLGERADTSVVRDSNAKSVIEAEMAIDDDNDIRKICAENDIEFTTGSIILRREIAPNGRSRAFINDTPVNLSVLQSIAVQLIDIHSQHQNLLIAQPDYQLRLIDAMAANADLKAQYAKAYTEYRKALRSYKLERKNIEQLQANKDILQYQYDTLKEAQLVDGELEDLEKERDILTNLEEIKGSLVSLLNALTEGEQNVEGLLKTSSDNAARLTSMIEDAESLAERIEGLRIEVRDIAASYQKTLQGLNPDPYRLEAVEDRLGNLYDLLRRYKTDTIADLIELLNDTKEKLREIKFSNEKLKALEKDARQKRKTAQDLAGELTKTRKDASRQFAEVLIATAMPLGMSNLQCKIDVTESEMTINGADKVEFLFGFNKNQELLPVGKTASGGEISRLMLSIKSILAGHMQLPAIIFDEVDTGVSGEIADRMGQLMHKISNNIQVIAITHLPQVAAKGGTHFKVYKLDTEQHTITRIKQLNNDERICEIAAMLSGDKINDAAKANAIALLGS